MGHRVYNLLQHMGFLQTWLLSKNSEFPHNKTIVIIPVYNSEKTIEQVLLSVVEQTAISEILEVIVVDDGSRDTSAIVIQAFIKAHPELHIHYDNCLLII